MTAGSGTCIGALDNATVVTPEEGESEDARPILVLHGADGTASVRIPEERAYDLEVAAQRAARAAFAASRPTPSDPVEGSHTHTDPRTVPDNRTVRPDDSDTHTQL